MLTAELFSEAEYRAIPFGRGLKVPSLFNVARSFIPGLSTSLDDDSTRRYTNFLRHSSGQTHAIEQQGDLMLSIQPDEITSILREQIKKYEGKLTDTSHHIKIGRAHV